MKKLIRKLGLSLAAVACFACASVGVALGFDGSLSVANAATAISESDFYVNAAGVRLINDANGAGIRFHTRITDAEYAKLTGNYETGTLIIPEIRYDGELTLDDAADTVAAKNRASKIVTTDIWWDNTEVEGWMQSTVYLHDVPEMAYGARYIARSYITYEDGTTVYSSVSPATSLTDISLKVQASSSYEEAIKTQVAPYIVEEVKVTYAMPDGSKQTKTVEYGSKLSDISIDYNKSAYALLGWQDQYGRTLDLANEEITLPLTLTPVFKSLQGENVAFNNMITDDYAATHENRAFNNSANPDVITTDVPEGYSAIYNYEAYGNSQSFWKAGGNPLYRSAYSDIDISGYDLVRFAMKVTTDGNAGIAVYPVVPNGNFVDTQIEKWIRNEWVEVQLEQTAANTWKMKLTNLTTGEIVYESAEYTRNASGVTDVDSVSSLVFMACKWDNTTPTLFVMPGSDAAMVSSVQFTEVLGYTELDYAPSVDSIKVADSGFKSTGWLTATDADGEEAPAGFSTVSKYMTDTTKWMSSALNQTVYSSDITAYEELWVAYKITGAAYWKMYNGTDYNNKARLNGTNAWVNYHLIQTADSTWTIEARIRGALVATAEGVSGNNIHNILWRSGYADGFLIYSTDYTTSVPFYATEVRGILKESGTGTDTETETAMDIPAEAKGVRNYVWRDDRYALTAHANVTMAAPEGYSYVIEDVWNSHHSNIVNQYTFAMDESLDVTAYSDLYFAMKIVDGSYIYVKDAGSAGHYTGSDWLYVHYHQDSAGVWSMSVASPDGYSATSSSTVSATTVKQLIDGRVYGYRTDTSMATKTYFTEIRGIPVDDTLWGDRVIWSAVDGAAEGDEYIAIPAGFEKTYKLTGFTKNSFAKLDLSNTIYEEIRFGMLADKDIGFAAGYNYKVEGEDTERPTTTIMYNTGSYPSMYLVELTKNDDGSWHVYMNIRRWAAAPSSGGSSLQTTDPFEADVTGDSLNAIFSQIFSTWGTITLYCTEVRGTHTCAYNITKSLGNGYLQDYCVCGKTDGNKYEFAHGIPEEAQQVLDQVWRSDDYALSTSTDEEVPAGYNNIVEFNWADNSQNWQESNKDMGLTCIPTDDLSVYSDVYFAMKLVGGDGIYLRSGSKYMGGDWLYVHYSQQDDGTWSLSLSSPDGYTAEKTGITGTTLQKMMSYEGTNNGLYPTRAVTYWQHKTDKTIVYEDPNDSDNYTGCSDQAAVVYLTDLRAIISCEHTAGVKYVSNNDGTHNEVCANCNTVLNANVECAGGTATCTEAAVCSTCNTAYGKALGHGDTTWNWGVATCNVCGETVGTAEIAASSAIIDSANAHLTLSNNAAGVTAPAGFSNVTNLFSASGNTWSSKILSKVDYSTVNLNPFDEVWFAIMIENGHVARIPDYSSADSDTELTWIKFHLIKEAENTWTIEITNAKGLWYTWTNQTGGTLGEIIDTSSDGARIVIYQKATNNLSDSDVNIYATEVLGVFNTGIPAYATNVWDHIWQDKYFEGGANANGSKWSTEAAPEGFTTTTECEWTGNNFGNKYGHVSAADISAYSDLYFAMKVVGDGTVYLQGASDNGYAGSEWVYVHYHQVSAGTWTKDYRTADGYYDPASKHTGITGSSLSATFGWKSGVNQGSYPIAADGVTATAYFTNVVGVLACNGTNHFEDSVVSNENGTHDVYCRCGTLVSDNIPCAGGVDTCKSGAICSDCGYVYGTAGAHTGGENTCTQGAICDVCGTEYGTALGHSGAWNETVENQYECARCGKYVGAVTTSLTEQTDVALFTNATYAALGASATGAFDATVETPANIDLSGFVSGLEISNVANVELNGTPYVVSSFADNVLTIQVIPYDVYGEYMLTATITVAGKTFDVEMPILVITDLITTNNGLLNVRKVLRGPDSATYTATVTYNSTEFRQFGGQGGTGTMDGNGYYKLGADITMSEIIIGEKHTDDYTQQLTYVFGTPTVPFAGTFDGAGYILNNYKSVKSAYNMIENRTKAVALVQDVSNISATSAGTTYENEPSLFGHMNGLVKNLAITNAQFGQYGNIVLSGTGAMENVYLDVANLQAPRYGDTAVENLSAIVAPLLQRSNGTNVILRNVVVDLRDAVFSGQTDDKIATHYPALIGPGLRTAENVAVYGFNTAWINSDGTRGNVYTGGSDGSAAGIYVKYADNTTNGASFWTSGLDSRIWKLVNDIPYLLRVNVSGTASEPSVPPTQSDNDNIVDNGTTEYYIGWNNADVFEQAYFIKDIMQQSSGATISVGDVDLTDFNKKQIVIGTYYEYAKYVFESGTGYTNDLATDGRANYGVYLVDRTFFVLADSDEGFEYAVQKLCRAVFGYNEIWIDEETYPDHTTALITLANVDADYLGTSQIAFNLRNAAYSSKAEEKNELGFTTMPHYTTYVEMHNSLDYFDGYTDANVIAIDSEGEQVDQVCYLARGNQTSFTNMINHVVGIIEAEKAENPNMTAINFMLEDNKNYCACTSCAKFTYASVPQQIFLNEVARKLAADGCDVDVAFFSYNAYSLAPIVTDTEIDALVELASTLGFTFEDTTDYVTTFTYDAPVDDNGNAIATQSSGYYTATSAKVLKSADGLRLWWTSHEANHSFALEHVANAHMYLALQAWIASIGAENVDVFMYQVAYRDYFMPLNTWEYQVLWYQSLNRLGVNSEMFNLGNIYNSASAQTGFAVFKTYIDSRAMRDSSVTFEQLKDEFFGVNGYYGPAGPTMRNFFEELVEVYEGHKQGGTNQFVATTAFTDQVNTLGTTGSGYIAGWYLDYYGSSNPNYYQYARQAFCNGTYSWNITSLVFGDLQSSTTPTPVTNMYEHSKYDSQAATLIAWYNYCQKALAEVSGNATYEKRIKLEAIFPEYAYLVYNSTYKTGLYYFWNNYTGSVTSTQPTIDRATFVDIDASATNWYQDFYTRVVGLGVTRPSEFYPFIETTTDTSDYSMVYDGMVPYYMYESFWKNWGITAS